MARVRTPAARYDELVQRSAEVNAPGLVDFVSLLAYRLCLNLPPAFTQPEALIFANLYDRILSIMQAKKSLNMSKNLIHQTAFSSCQNCVHPVFIKGLPRLPLKAIIMRVSSREEQLARIAMFARTSILSDAKSLAGAFL